MGSSLWEGLGKLVQAGANWVQHVQQARAAIAAGDQGQALLHAYLARLSDADFSGFKLAIAMAVQGEAHPQIRQLLAWIVQNADHLRSANIPPPDMTASAVTTPAAYGHAAQAAPPGEYDQVLALVNQWLGLPASDIATRMRGVIAPLDAVARERFVGHLAQLLEVTKQNLQVAEQQSDNAWGSSYEDRMAYLSARISTGQRDPRAEQQLATLRGHVEFVTQLLQGASFLIREPVPVSPAAPLAAPASVVAPARSVSAAHGDGADSSMAMFAQQLRVQLEQAIATGEIRPGREAALRTLTDEVAQLALRDEQGTISHTDAHAAMMRLVERSRDMLVDAGPDLRAQLPADSRAHALVAHVHRLKTFASECATRAPGPQSQEAGMALYAHAARLLVQLGTLGDDAAALEFERSSLRALALDAQRLARAPHARPATPVWDCPPVDLSPNRVFVAGTASFRHAMKTWLRERRMEVEAQPDGRVFGQARWDELRRSAVAVFDLRAYRRHLFEEDTDAALLLAGVSYELGLALALGKAMVVVAAPEQSLPFDIDIEPLRLSGAAEDATLMREAIDAALYGGRLAADAQSLGVALDMLDDWSLEAPRRASIEGMGWLKRELAADALAFEAAARQVLREIGRGELLTPVWASHRRPATESAQRQLFHVMPFSASWSDDICEVGRAACLSTDVRYVRGDTIPDARILNRVWDGICHADALLVELTGLNANVMIELGIAHALGGNVLLVEQAQSHAGKVRHLEKFEIHRYEDARTLRAALVQWLG